MNALWRNLGRINEKVLETHPLAMAINSLLPEEGRIECTPTELLERLEEEAEKLKLNLKSELWPKSTIALGRRLRELISNLEEAGIKVMLLPRLWLQNSAQFHRENISPARGWSFFYFFQSWGKPSADSAEGQKIVPNWHNLR
jgi:hypothetical protein